MFMVKSNLSRTFGEKVEGQKGHLPACSSTYVGLGHDVLVHLELTGLVGGKYLVIW